MPEHDLLRLLCDVARGDITPEECLKHCRTEPFRKLASGLCLDTQRALRTGMGEVVLAEGKDDARLVEAVKTLAGDGPVLVTRVSREQGALLATTLPDGTFWEQARLFATGADLPLAPPWSARGEVLILTGGAADLPVALETLGTLRFCGVEAGLVPDIGVAGLHRITPHLDAMDDARILVVVAGMEGALPGVIAGMTGTPVVAVPTSVGYGTGAGGLSALLSMLNACAPGIAVVNIDNGFGAATFAAKLLRSLR